MKNKNLQSSACAALFALVIAFSKTILPTRANAELALETIPHVQAPLLAPRRGFLNPVRPLRIPTRVVYTRDHAPIQTLEPTLPTSSIAPIQTFTYTDSAAQPTAMHKMPSAPLSLFGQLTGTMVRSIPRNIAAIFDNSSPRRASELPNGSPLDTKPRLPAPEQHPQFEVNSVTVPDIPSSPNAILGTRSRAVPQAGPVDSADVERMVRTLIDDKPLDFGVSSKDLATVHVKLIPGIHVPGIIDQADTYYAFFQQTKNGIAVEGATAGFIIKVIHGVPQVVAAHARLVPHMPVETHQQISDADMLLNIGERIGVTDSQELAQMKFDSRKIIFINNAWHAVDLYAYALPRLQVTAAVDIVTGETFVWRESPSYHADMQKTIGSRLKSLAGRILARAEAYDHRPGNVPALVKIPLAYLNIAAAGQKDETDGDGNFSIPATNKKPVFKARLDGRYARVFDDQGKTIELTVTLDPDNANAVIFNPTAQDEVTVNALNTYIHYNQTRDWWNHHLNGDKRLNRKIQINVNVAGECNAWFNPIDYSLNFVPSSENCTDSGRPTIIHHETTHSVSFNTGGVSNGALDEGMGDMGAMFQFGIPVVGEGFLKFRTPSYVRSGENTYRYGLDEIHTQGQAWMGSVWKLRAALIAAFKEEAGAALAEKMALPIMLAKAPDIPTALLYVLLNAIDKEGRLHPQIAGHVRKAAAAHAIKLPSKINGGEKRELALTE